MADKLKMKVLVADDTRSCLLYLSSCVEKMGLQVITAENGQDAVDKYEQYLPDLILIDVTMPIMDGVEAVEQIRGKCQACNHWVPIILISGLDGEQDIIRGLESGADHYIVKPISADLLASRLNALLRIYATQAELNKQNNALKHSVEFDELTQLFHRNKFKYELKKEWLRCLRNGDKLALCMCEVDQFKQYNELYGSYAGDDVLLNVAEVLKDSFKRPADLVTRYSGCQFAIILPDTDLAGALCTAERSKSLIDELRIEHEQSPTGYIDISAGVGMIHPEKNYPGDPLKGLVRCAEIALEASKKHGRDNNVSDCIAQSAEITEFA